MVRARVRVTVTVTVALTLTLRDAQRILGGQPHAEDAARLDSPAAACARRRLREQWRRAVQQAGDAAAARREPVVGVVGDEAYAVATLGAQRGERPGQV